MANKDHIKILLKGVETWNAWREQNRDMRPDLFGATLSEANLRGTDLREADLSEAGLYEAYLVRANLSATNLIGAILIGANLREADLRGANLRGAKLVGANFREANLFEANLRGADLCGANLRKANLRGANLRGADLGGADLFSIDLGEAELRGAKLYETVLANIDLSSCKGLEDCDHRSPSTIDHRTLQRSGPLPLAFLRGVGLPDNLIDYLPSLLNQPIEFYSCFISYSSKDQAFAERLHADLQAKGVRCWFAPHDMPIGAKILDAIDEAIRLRDKVLLVLSEGALASDWVEGEVTRALDEERGRGRTLLFPIRIDDTVLQTKEAWARLLRGQRNIGDFTRWKEHDAYQKGLERLLRDLKVEAASPPSNK